MSPVRRALQALVAVGALCGACSSEGDQARAAVTRYFAALDAHDCKTFQGMMADQTKIGTCAEVIKEHDGRHVKLLGLEPAVPDGRDPKVFLVKTHLHYEQEPHDWLIRVERKDGQWKLNF